MCARPAQCVQALRTSQCGASGKVPVDMIRGRQLQHLRNRSLYDASEGRSAAEIRVGLNMGT
jgi:hypothetical protein